MKSIILSLFLIFSAFVYGQIPVEELDQSKLISNLTKTNASADFTTTIIWMPPTYWDLIGQQMNAPQLSQTIMDQIGPYQLFLIFAGEISATNIEPFSRDDFEKKLILQYNGTDYKPLRQKELNDFQKELGKQLKPMFQGMMGQMGSGFEMMYFDIPPSELNELKEGSFKITFIDKVFTYRLPLPAFYPDKSCPEDNEKFPSDYDYCPYHGKALTE